MWILLRSRVQTDRTVCLGVSAQHLFVIFGGVCLECTVCLFLGSFPICYRLKRALYLYMSHVECQYCAGVTVSKGELYPLCSALSSHSPLIGPCRFSCVPTGWPTISWIAPTAVLHVTLFTMSLKSQLSEKCWDFSSKPWLTPLLSTQTYLLLAECGALQSQLDQNFYHNTHTYPDDVSSVCA